MIAIGCDKFRLRGFMIARVNMCEYMLEGERASTRGIESGRHPLICLVMLFSSACIYERGSYVYGSSALLRWPEHSYLICVILSDPNNK